MRVRGEHDRNPARLLHLADVVHRQHRRLFVPVGPARPLDGRADPDDRPPHGDAGFSSTTPAASSNEMLRTGPVKVFRALTSHQTPTISSTMPTVIGA